ncbi:MAG TPA: histidine phosphatase family protein [Acidothermaceae bacterium]
MEQTGGQPGAAASAAPADAEQPVGELVVLRHGATQWSTAGKHTGRTDVPLSLQGEQQAEMVGALIAGRTFALVLASPLQRAQLTAELAGLRRFDTDADLVEWDYGGYEGMTTAEIRRIIPGWSLWRDGVTSRADGQPGETATDAGARADHVIARVLPVLGSGDVALVSHGHFLRVLAARWLSLPPTGGALLALDTASVSVLGFEHGAHVLRHWNLLAR